MDRLQTKLVEPVTSIRSSCRYLVHADNPGKVQYEKVDLKGSSSMVRRAKSYLSSDMNSQIRDIQVLLNSIDGPISYSDFLWLCTENCLAPTLRGVKVLTLLNDHNFKYGWNEKYV